MKGNYGKDLNILSEQLGKDAVSRVHRLELENQRLQRELEAAKTDRNKIEKEAAYEFEMENKKVQASISRLEEQVGETNRTKFVGSWGRPQPEYNYILINSVN